MDADEQTICDFLKSFPKLFVSAREISRRAAGKKRFRDNPHWATQVLLRLAEKGVLESDSTGHYRLRPPEKKNDRKRWISPQIKQLLKQSGKDFEGVIEINDEEEPPSM
jgi:hypothetical protein